MFHWDSLPRPVNNGASLSSHSDSRKNATEEAEGWMRTRRRSNGCTFPGPTRDLYHYTPSCWCPTVSNRHPIVKCPTKVKQQQKRICETIFRQIALTQYNSEPDLTWLAIKNTEQLWTAVSPFFFFASHHGAAGARRHFPYPMYASSHSRQELTKSAKRLASLSCYTIWCQLIHDSVVAQSKIHYG